MESRNLQLFVEIGVTVSIKKSIKSGFIMTLQFTNEKPQVQLLMTILLYAKSCSDKKFFNAIKTSIKGILKKNFTHRTSAKEILMLSRAIIDKLQLEKKNVSKDSWSCEDLRSISQLLEDQFKIDLRWEYRYGRRKKANRSCKELPKVDIIIEQGINNSISIIFSEDEFMMQNIRFLTMKCMEDKDFISFREGIEELHYNRDIESLSKALKMMELYCKDKSDIKKEEDNISDKSSDSDSNSLFCSEEESKMDIKEETKSNRGNTQIETMKNPLLDDFCYYCGNENSSKLKRLKCGCYVHETCMSKFLRKRQSTVPKPRHIKCLICEKDANWNEYEAPSY